MPNDFLLTRSARRRRTVALRVLPDGTLTVQAPLRTSLKWIESFVATRAGWIAKRREEAAKAQDLRPQILKAGSKIPYLGTMLTLEIAEGSYAPPVLTGSTLRLSLAPGLSEQTRQAEIRTELILWYKKQARSLFGERFAFWAEQMKVKPLRLLITAPERRWGSCSADNEIRLNWRLIMGRCEWLDYVIVHELAHIPHKNHGPAFWRCVGRAIPSAQETRKALQNWKGENWL